MTDFMADTTRGLQWLIAVIVVAVLAYVVVSYSSHVAEQERRQRACSDLGLFYVSDGNYCAHGREVPHDQS